MNKSIAKNYLDDILTIIKKYNPTKVILFGSMNTDASTEDSDLDLLIVLDIDNIPSSYEERMKLKLMIRRALREINRKIPIDLLVYTKKEYEIMKREKSSFYKEIIKSGKTVYEAA